MTYLALQLRRLRQRRQPSCTARSRRSSCSPFWPRPARERGAGRRRSRTACTCRPGRTPSIARAAGRRAAGRCAARTSRSGAKLDRRAALWEVRRRREAPSCSSTLRASLERSFVERDDSPRCSRACSTASTRTRCGSASRGASRPTSARTLLFARPRAAAPRCSIGPGGPCASCSPARRTRATSSGQEILKKIVELTRTPSASSGRVFFLEDYDIDARARARAGRRRVAQQPDAPAGGQRHVGHEGRGERRRSTCRSATAGGSRRCDGDNGWTIGDGRVYANPELQDELDAETLYRLLEEEVVPLFFERDAEGLPRRWLERVRHALETMPPVFDTDRMVPSTPPRPTGRWRRLAPTSRAIAVVRRASARRTRRRCASCCRR